MSTLLYKPTPEIFSQIPVLEEVVVSFSEKGVLKLIENVGQIFVKHGVHKKFGITMAHRHFDMSEEEILVESIRNDKALSIFIPWNVTEGKSATPSDPSLWTSYGMENSEKNYILPQNWVFDAFGDVVPFEFLATDNKTALSKPPADFVRELYEILKDLGVERLVGLRSIEQMGTVSTWETTPDNIRANVLVHGEMPKEMSKARIIKVLWRFNEKGILQEGNASCFGCWCSHCNHCGSCTH